MKRKPKPDVFDYFGKKFTNALVSSCFAVDRLAEPFRSGGITSLEELAFRLTGRYFDWEEWKPMLVANGYGLDETGNLVRGPQRKTKGRTQ